MRYITLKGGKDMPIKHLFNPLAITCVQDQPNAIRPDQFNSIVFAGGVAFPVWDYFDEIKAEIEEALNEEGAK